MEGLTEVDVDELTQDEIECPICKVKFATSAGPQVGTGASSSALTPTNNDQVVAEVSTQEGVVVKQATPETPFKLACGHIIGESCIQSWINHRERGTQPTCPICRTAIRGIEVPEIAIVVTLDELRELAALLGINSDRD